MKTRVSGLLTLAAVIFLTAAGLFGWLGFLAVLWLALNAAGFSPNFWAMIEALSTAVTTAAVLSAGYIAYRELDELAASRHIEVADRLFDELNSSASIEARRWVFRNLPDDPQQGVQGLSAEGRRNVKQVLNSLDRVAFLTQAGWIEEKMIMPWMNPMIVKAWSKLAPYVDYESQRRREPDYYEQARKLAERCVQWRSKNLPEAEITWVDDAL